jgi:hypothetical protein
LGAEHGKLDADLRTSALLGTPSVQSVHDYYPFAMKDGGRLAPVADELVDIAWIVCWQFVASLVWVMQTLVDCIIMTIMSGCNISSVDLLTFPFDGFWGMCGENFCNVFALHGILWVPMLAMLSTRVVPMLRRASVFRLGLRPERIFLIFLFFILIGALQHCFFF